MGGGQFSFPNSQQVAPDAVRIGQDSSETKMPAEPVFVPQLEGILSRGSPRKAVAARPPAKPQNIVKLAKDRLREVKKELKQKKALEKERDELERLIAAAEGNLVTTTAGKVVGTIKPASTG